jgi:hypothetical protein
MRVRARTHTTSVPPRDGDTDRQTDIGSKDLQRVFTVLKSTTLNII